MTTPTTNEATKKPARVLSYAECIQRWGGSQRSWTRLIGENRGPAVIKITERRRGVLEDVFEAWLRGLVALMLVIVTLFGWSA